MKKYYPNNWQAIKDAPPEAFKSLPFYDFYEWRILNWELPKQVSYIIRERNLETDEIREHVYRQHAAARKKCVELFKRGDTEITVVNDEAVHHVNPNELFL
jgi:hypothetical protein